MIMNVVTQEQIKELNDSLANVEDRLDKHTVTPLVSITKDTVYVCPTDGYIRVEVTPSESGKYCDADILDNTGTYRKLIRVIGFSTTHNINTMYVRKGTTLKWSGTGGTCSFLQLV